jgi:hypothetical protein
MRPNLIIKLLLISVVGLCLAWTPAQKAATRIQYAAYPSLDIKAFTIFIDAPGELTNSIATTNVTVATPDEWMQRFAQWKKTGETLIGLTITNGMTDGQIASAWDVWIRQTQATNQVFRSDKYQTYKVATAALRTYDAATGGDIVTNVTTNVVLQYKASWAETNLTRNVTIQDVMELLR